MLLIDEYSDHISSGHTKEPRETGHCMFCKVHISNRITFHRTCQDAKDMIRGACMSKGRSVEGNNFPNITVT
jgi:hypothetical protein